MSPQFIDTHIHLADDRFFPYLEQIVNAANAIDMILVANSEDFVSSTKNLEIAKSYPKNVKAFVGIHPSESLKENVEDVVLLLAKNRGLVAGIGEIGLDRKYTDNEEDYRVEKEIFTDMLGFAERLNKPVSVHSRGSVDDVLEELCNHSVDNVALHWFSGDLNQMKRASDKGYYVSFGPAAVYSKKIRKVAMETPADLLLVETDGPVPYGACFGGRMGWPLYLPSIIYALAYERKVGYHELSEQILQNSMKFIGDS
ncbi:MAG: hypothetical protein CMO12_01300 [Thaumarchaeota archaeon]|nr:hypothetical protein [Nitrososphaerota archaeon]